MGQLGRNGNNLTWHDRTGAVALQMLVGGGIFGLTLSNGTDATNDINIAAGVTVDDAEGTVLRRTASITKQLDAAWAVGTNAGGLDTGSIANTTYHVFLIQRTDTGVVDALFSTSATAPTLPTSYTLQRRIGSILREGGTIIAFTQYGDLFQRATAVLDVNVTAPGTAAVTRTLSVPVGINVRPVIHVFINRGEAGGFSVLFTDLAATDVAPVVQTATQGQIYSVGGNDNLGWVSDVTTNTSAQIRSRVTNSVAGTTLAIATQGWYDTRQKDV